MMHNSLSFLKLLLLIIFVDNYDVHSFQLTREYLLDKYGHINRPNNEGAAESNFTTFKLDLYSADITSIDEFAFENMTGIEFLDLSHNELGAIQPGTFRGLTRLIELNIGKKILRYQFFYFVSLYRSY